MIMLLNIRKKYNLKQYIHFLPANFSARVRASVVLELDDESSEFSAVDGFSIFSIENGDASMIILCSMLCFTN